MAWQSLAIISAGQPKNWLYTPSVAANLFRVSYIASPSAWGRVLIAQASPNSPRERFNVRKFWISEDSDLYLGQIPSPWQGEQAIGIYPYAWSSSVGLEVAIEYWDDLDPSATPTATLDLILQKLNDMEAKIDAL
jgi:hypothetical protein